MTEGIGMFRLNGERERLMLPAAQRSAGRTGAAVDGWRLLRILKRHKRLLLTLLVLSAAIGAVTGRYLLIKTYVARAVLLWEPPATARAERIREISTLVDSVKIPANLAQVRERLGYQEPLEALAQRIDVESGENSMLITITGRTTNRNTAAALTNAMVDVYLESQKKVSEARLQETAQSLRHSLVQSQKSLDEARGRYDQFRKEHRIGDLGIEVQAAIEEVARLRVAANDARVELDSSEAEESVLRKQRASAPATIVGATPEENRALTARLAEVEANLADARAKYTDEHPRVRLLSGEASELRNRVNNPAEQPKATTRNPAYSVLGARVEQSAAAKRAAEQRRKALQDVIQESEDRASKLTSVEGETARLLADVSVLQDHVAALLKQAATAEDDVRSATSYFQIISKATPPEHSEKGLGRIVAVATPLLTMLTALLILGLREMRNLSVRTAAEASYWSKAPVLWSSGWPAGPESETRELGRELANVLEARPAVVGISVCRVNEGDEETSAWLATLVVERLNSRGVASSIIDLRYRALEEQADLADALEHKQLGEEIRALRADSHATLAVLPNLDDIAAVRASLRWIDALVVIIPSGKVKFTWLDGLRRSLGLMEHGLGLVLVDVPLDLLDSSSRTAAGAYSFWPPPRRRRRSSIMPAQISQHSTAAVMALEGMPPPR